LAFEGLIELLSGLLGLNHRVTHTRLVALCLFCTCVRQIGAAPLNWAAGDPPFEAPFFSAQ